MVAVKSREDISSQISIGIHSCDMDVCGMDPKVGFRKSHKNVFQLWARTQEHSFSLGLNGNVLFFQK